VQGDRGGHARTGQGSLSGAAFAYEGAPDPQRRFS
jgi:hypothetical protein